ncbi:hypothetical protein NSE_0231 [Neorickettsia sennetsu str. Miyayama]|uniref:Lipoprotein n=1 Tax=Ehrlichia sennetsu (strain ATCC VR-367 / Miyayama) TaxID=222891 RepID=Q2GEH1_EHRS3|nr:hypothetical protein NSE_0231 [Neorickettsia sennetsu str. Miyayama]
MVFPAGSDLLSVAFCRENRIYHIGIVNNANMIVVVYLPVRS